MKSKEFLTFVILALHLLYVAIVLLMPFITSTPLDPTTALTTISNTLGSAVLEILVIHFLCAQLYDQ